MSDDCLSVDGAQMLHGTKLELATAYQSFLSHRYPNKGTRIFKSSMMKKLVHEIAEETLWRSIMSQNSFMTSEEYQQNPKNQFLTSVLRGDAKTYRDNVTQKTDKNCETYQNS